MDDPSAPDPHSPERSGPRVPIDRAAILLGLFVIAVVLLLSQIHTPVPATSGSAAAPTTTSTVPGSPTTTAPARATTTTTTAVAKAKSNVPVLVANASGKPGAAATITNELQVAGWNVQAPINATANVATSTVYYVAGQKVAATAVAATLHLTPSAVLPYTTAAPVSTIGTAEVLVVVAPDLAGATTSTTAATGT
ncbi:MAG TPA: LytR C-terminal domain-containing protein [Acidimicrobiales bacterium]